MVKKTITHSLTITVDGLDTPITVSDATAALVALEAYKMGKALVKVPGSEDGCVIYINSKYIISVQDCVTESETTVVDSTCVEE